LEYLGRIDHQVKIRGYRIELGEIEATLADHDGVKACAVLAREDVPGNKQLVGYVTAKKGATIDAKDLRHWLAGKLPDYMTPAQFVFLDSLPLTSNGKVDRQRLPAATVEAAPRTASDAPPRSEIETKLANIWCALLNLESIGVNDNFFELGAHSLLAIKAASRIKEALGAEISAQDVFDDPTIAGLARILGGKAGRSDDVAEKRRPFFFGDPQLFGVFHPAPAGSARDTALLVCPSIGHEYTRAYRAVQHLCEAAAGAGVPALQFDYSGVGDSAGEFSRASLDVWIDDVLRAMAELVERSGARQITIVGLRFGAALAVEALRRAGPGVPRPVKSVILWDPILSGGEFLDVARRFQELFLADAVRFTARTLRARRKNGSAVDDQCVGYAYPTALRLSLARLDVRRDAWPSIGVRAVLSEPSNAWNRQRVQLESARGNVVTDLLQDSEASWSEYALHERVLRAGPVVSRIVERLVEDGV
jgi:pimeloyl-ACP methyl ester carboxylesterase